VFEKLKWVAVEVERGKGRSVKVSLRRQAILLAHPHVLTHWQKLFQISASQNSWLWMQCQSTTFSTDPPRRSILNPSTFNPLSIVLLLSLRMSRRSCWAVSSSASQSESYCFRQKAGKPNHFNALDLKRLPKNRSFLISNFQRWLPACIDLVLLSSLLRVSTEFELPFFRRTSYLTSKKLDFRGASSNWIESWSLSLIALSASTRLRSAASLLEAIGKSVFTKIDQAGWCIIYPSIFFLCSSLPSGLLSPRFSLIGYLQIILINKKCQWHLDWDTSTTSYPQRLS